MELSWINKLRIALVAALGIAVIGIVGWPLAAPNDPMAPVRSTNVSLLQTTLLMLSAFAIGLGGYFLSWPHGREIGILGVPFGLAVWSLRSGPMRVLNQAANTVAGRSALLNSLLLEPLYWLVIVAVGFAGVLIAQRLAPSDGAPLSLDKIKSYLTSRAATTLVIAVLVSVIVVQFLLGAIAMDVPPFDRIAATQPPVGQIAFAVIAAFAAAAFIVKLFLGESYIWPAIASVFVTPFAQAAYCRGSTIERFTEIEPATFFPHASLAIMPLQLVAFGAIGSVLGYWLAISYRYWRTHPATA
jgi:hypothetical protein